VRDVLLAHLDAATTRSHHLALAEALASSDGADPEAVARHLALAGESERAIGYALQAAQKKIAELAYLRAADLYRLVLSLMPAHDHAVRAEPQVKLAEALENAGHARDAARIYLEAAATAEGDRLQFLRQRAAMQLLRAGRFEEGVQTLEQVVNAAGWPSQPTSFRALLTLIFFQLWLSLRGLRYRERSQADIDPALLRRIELCWTAATALICVDALWRAEFLYRHALLALRAGESSHIARGLVSRGWWRSVSRSVRGRNAGERLLTQAEAIARRRDDAYPLGMAAFARGMRAFCEGRLAAALKTLEQAEELFLRHCTGVHYELSGVYGMQVATLVLSGRLAEVTSRLERLLVEATERDDRFTVISITTGDAIVAWLSSDQPDETRRALGACAFELTPRSPMFTSWAMASASVHLYCGDGAAAWRSLIEGRVEIVARQLLSYRISVSDLRGRCALLLARKERRYLSTAAGEARQLLRTGTPHAAALALLLQAGIDAAQGLSESAVERCAEAARAFASLAMALHENAARYRQGILLGAAGQSQVAAALEYCRAQAIKNPERMFGMLAP
jgi:hypothetical protein